MNLNIDLTPSLDTIIEFFLIWVIWRGIIVRRLSGIIEKYVFIPLGLWLKSKLIRSKQDLTLYLHYLNKSRKKGHQCRYNDCDDDWCGTA